MSLAEKSVTVQPKGSGGQRTVCYKRFAAELDGRRNRSCMWSSHRSSLQGQHERVCGRVQEYLHGGPL